MKSKELTVAQIEALFKFMRSKYVRYYDVQIELVDHFASAIEAMWEENPAMTFEQGIDKVYAEFPITGFNNLIQEKTSVLTKKIRRHAWKEVKNYFQIPKIMLTLLVFTLLYLLFSSVQEPLMYAYAIWFVVFMGSSYMIRRLRDQGSKKQDFLVLNTLMYSEAVITLAICIPPHDIIGFGLWSNWATVALSILSVFVILFCVGHYKVACSIFEEWKVQYPQFV